MVCHGLNRFLSFYFRVSSPDSSFTSLKRSALFSAFLLLASAFSAFSESPLTEKEVRAWAETATEAQKTEALVTLAMNLEELMRLQNEDSKDWTESRKKLTAMIAALQADLGEARRSSTKAAESFEKSLKAQTQKMTAIDSEKRAWRLASLVFLGGAAGYAIDRNINGFNGLIWGLVAGGATGVLWSIFDNPP